MDRTAATAYLTEEYSDLATDAGFTSTQITAAYSTATDQALRQLGIAEADLATADIESDVLKYTACLNYYALLRFARLLALRFDVSLPGPVKADRSQAFDRVKQLMDEAADELAGLGILVGSASKNAFQMGRVNLDFLEPGTVDEFGIPPVGLFWW